MNEQAGFAIRTVIRQVVDGGTLSMAEAETAMDAIMSGEATPAQIAAVVTALRMRGETVEEIAGFARAMRRHSLKVETEPGRTLVDTCGTGGDDSGTFNISTTAAFVIAGAGVTVAKHGNRAVTSHCGSADLLEGLGVRIDLPPAEVSRCLDEAGIGFMFAPVFHPGFRHAGPTRREIGIRTVFNILGPLTNPAGVKRQLIGVGNLEIGQKLAAAHGLLGCERVVVVHSGEGLDEIGVSGVSDVIEYDAQQGGIRTYQIAPEDFGIVRSPIRAVLGGDVTENVAISLRILAGETGAPRDVVVLNAAAGLYAAGVVDSIAAGVNPASEAIDNGRALAALERLIDVSQSAAGSAA